MAVSGGSIVNDLIDAFRRDLTRLRAEVQRSSPQFMAELTSILEEGLRDVSSDSDRRNKEEVYGTIAEFFCERLKMPRDLVLVVTWQLCRESDPRIVEDREQRLRRESPGALDAALASARELILSVEVHYVPMDRSTYRRVVRIYFVEGERPKISLTEETVPWDLLPPDVRRHHLTKGPQPLVFQLFPQREEETHG